MLNTKDMSAGTGKAKPVIGTGNQKIKINSITFDQTPYDMDAYNITLHVESEPMGGDFNGFLKDVNNPSGPRFEGQVGRVRFSPYPFKDTTLPNGNEIIRDNEVLKAMIFLSETVNKREELDSIEASTIEEFMSKASGICSNTGYINACLGAREWENREGYVNNDLFLPKRTRMGIPLEALAVRTESTNGLPNDASNHFRPFIKKEPAVVNSFEPSSTSGSDFEL